MDSLVFQYITGERPHGIYGNGACGAVFLYPGPGGTAVADLQCVAAASNREGGRAVQVFGLCAGGGCGHGEEEGEEKGENFVFHGEHLTFISII